MKLASLSALGFSATLTIADPGPQVCFADQVTQNTHPQAMVDFLLRNIDNIPTIPLKSQEDEPNNPENLPTESPAAIVQEKFRLKTIEWIKENNILDPQNPSSPNKNLHHPKPHRKTLTRIERHMAIRKMGLKYPPNRAIRIY